MTNLVLLNKEKKIPLFPQNERRENSTTPERVAEEETRKFEETSKKLQELKELVPKKNKDKQKGQK